MKYISILFLALALLLYGCGVQSTPDDAAAAIFACATFGGTKEFETSMLFDVRKVDANCVGNFRVYAFRKVTQ